MITVLFNPASGGKHPENLASHLNQLFAASGLQARIVPLDASGDVVGLVQAAIDAGADAVVAAGGDGTVSSVAAGLIASDTPLGVLPLGTLNHLAKDLHIPLDLERAVHTIASRHVTRIDVGEVNSRIFVNNSSIGIYPDIVLQREELRRQGYRKWMAFAVATARILRQYRGVAVRITVGTTTEVSRTPFLFVGNNEYRVEGIGLGARTRLDSGRLFAYLAPRVHGQDLPKLLALALVGRADEHSLESFAATDLQVDTPGSRWLRVALDGEVSVLRTPLNYRVRPLALRVLVPAG